MSTPERQALNTAAEKEEQAALEKSMQRYLKFGNNETRLIEMAAKAIVSYNRSQPHPVIEEQVKENDRIMSIIDDRINRITDLLSQRFTANKSRNEADSALNADLKIYLTAKQLIMEKLFHGIPLSEVDLPKTTTNIDLMR